MPISSSNYNVIISNTFETNIWFVTILTYYIVYRIELVNSEFNNLPIQFYLCNLWSLNFQSYFLLIIEHI